MYIYNANVQQVFLEKHKFDCFFLSRFYPYVHTQKTKIFEFAGAPTGLITYHVCKYKYYSCYYYYILLHTIIV